MLDLPFVRTCVASSYCFPRGAPLNAFPRTLTKRVHTANLRCRGTSRTPHARADRHPVRRAARRRHCSTTWPTWCRFRSSTRPTRRCCSRRSAPSARSSCSPGTSTPFRPQDNLPGRIEDGWVVGLGASDMKGGRRGDGRARALGGRAARRSALDLALPLLRARGAARRGERPAARLRRGAARARVRPRRHARADRQRDPRRLPRQPQRDADFQRRERPLGAALAGRERDRARGRGARARWSRCRRSRSRSAG